MEEGYALLQLHPKTKTEEMSHFVRHDTIKSLFGVSWEGVPLPIMSLRADFARSLLRLIEGIVHHPINTFLV